MAAIAAVFAAEFQDFVYCALLLAGERILRGFLADLAVEGLETGA